MLIFNQAILIYHLPTTLVLLMQLQDVGICVDGKPKSMALNPTNDHNFIVVPSDNGGITLWKIPVHIQGGNNVFQLKKTDETRI